MLFVAAQNPHLYPEKIKPIKITQLEVVFFKDHRLTWDWWNNELKLLTNLIS